MSSLQHGRRPGSFIRMLGAEYELLKKSGGNVLRKFYLATCLIVFIAIVSFFSIVYAIELLFHDVVVEILLSSFLSGLLVLMYIFLINTFSATSADNHINLSNITRTVFIVFMAFMLSKPIESFVFREQFNHRVLSYKEELLNNHTRQIDRLFNADRKLIEKELQRYTSMNGMIDFSREIELLTHELSTLGERREALLNISKNRIYKSDYFLYRVKLSSESVMCWLICLVVIILYILPGFLIYSLSHSNDYHKLKDEYEKRFIRRDYNRFAQLYAEIFLKKYGTVTSVYSIFEDPPFNSLRKKEQEYQPASEFYKKFIKPDGL